MKTRQEIQNTLLGRVCVCKHFWGWNKKDERETDYHCNNKTCVWWNIVTNEHSTPYTELDQLYEMTYERGICDCREPKLHEIDGKIVEDYMLCVNHECFKVLREYKPIVVDQRLYQ